MHEPASHHHGPEAVGEVLIERAIAAAGGEARPAWPGGCAGARARPCRLGFTCVLFAGREDRLGQLGPAGHPRARQVVIVLDEHRVEREVAARLLGGYDVFFVAFLAG